MSFPELSLAAWKYAKLQKKHKPFTGGHQVCPPSSARPSHKNHSAKENKVFAPE